MALDDFGTGYSSLLNLRRLPVTKLKIDKGFVRGCLNDPDDLAIVASVVDLAAKLGVECVAEGVESLQQAALLHELGCRAGQGFLWSPAVPLSAGDRHDAIPPPEAATGRPPPVNVICRTIAAGTATRVLVLTASTSDAARANMSPNRSPSLCLRNGSANSHRIKTTPTHDRVKEVSR